MRLLRKLVRLKCLAFQQQIPKSDLAVQRQIQGEAEVRYATPDRGIHPAEIPRGVQWVTGRQGFHHYGHERTDGTPDRYDRS